MEEDIREIAKVLIVILVASSSNSTNENTYKNYRLATPQEVLDKLNLVWTDPKGYVKYLQERLNSFAENFVYIEMVLEDE